MRATDAPLWSPPSLSQAPPHDALWNALASFAGSSVALAGRSEAALSLGRAPAPGVLGLLVRFGPGPGIPGPGIPGPGIPGADILAVPVIFPFEAVCQASLAVEDLAGLPASLRDAILEGLAGVALSALPETGHDRPTVAASGPWDEIAGEDPAALRWFRATLHGVAPQPVVFDLGATLPDLAALFGDGPAPRRLWGDLKTRLSRDAFSTLGRLRLTAGAARGLAVGSLIVVAADFDPQFAILRVGAQAFRFRPQGGAWACLDVAPMEHHTSPIGGQSMTEPTAHPAEDGTTAAGLGIAVDLDIGRLTVSLAELETWQPGSIVAIQPAVLGRGVEVTLRNEGRRIGTGDLVTVDDRLAIRVSSLAFDD